MTIRSWIAKAAHQEELNFLLTNRIPRRLTTKFMGWFSRIEQPLIRDLSIFIWQLFCDVNLSEAKESHFKSLHDAFIRELKPGARPITSDSRIMVSPCDAIIGACGRVKDHELLQIKGFPYTLSDLLGENDLIGHFRNGRYVTLRLTAGMYHRFHAPHDGVVEEVAYIYGDTWNVNSIALKRIERLFCKNERAAIRMRLTQGPVIALVPVAAILVAGIKLNFLKEPLPHGSKNWHALPCEAKFRKGEEMGWFEHGSTLIVLAPGGFSLCENISEGHRIRTGESLLRLPGIG